MPRKSPRPCLAPGCPGKVSGDHRYCDSHRALEQDYDRGRGSPDSRGYDTRWRKLRRMVLARHPLCVDPYHVHTTPEAATEVDHIIPKRQGGQDAFENLQGLCKSCHSRKTLGEAGQAVHVYDQQINDRAKPVQQEREVLHLTDASMAVTALSLDFIGASRSVSDVYTDQEG